nr:peptidyl-prolyl cis-trans isomerase FKBP8-like [Onthophagus taurus]
MVGETNVEEIVLNTSEKEMKGDGEDVTNGIGVGNEAVIKEKVVDEGVQVKKDDEVKEITVAKDDEDEEDGDKWEDVLGSGSILKRVIKKGENDLKPQKYHVCKINYVCKLENGLEVEREENFLMQVDGCDVVQGLDLSIAMMNVGEICELKIQPRLAFGAKGLPPLIPPNTTVIYEVALLSIVEEETDNLSVADRKERGNNKRKRGNWWYGRGENMLAIQCYRRALDYLDELEGGIKDPNSSDNEISDVDLQSLLEDRISVSNNMAAAQIKLNLFDQALNSLELVLKCQPENVKALFRKAKVYKAKNELPMALKYLQKANEIAPDDQDIIKEISTLGGLIKKQKVSEKQLAQRMFNLKDNDDKKKLVKSNRSRFQMWTVFGVSVMVTLASIAAYKFKYM